MMEYNWTSWKSLPLNYKKEFCSLSDCSHCNEKERETMCSLWAETDIRYNFLMKITKALDNDLKLRLCELTICSYKTNPESKSLFYSGKDRHSPQYCSKWFGIMDFSILVPTAKMDKIGVDDIDSLVKEIAGRWNVEIS